MPEEEKNKYRSTNASPGKKLPVLPAVPKTPLPATKPKPTKRFNINIKPVPATKKQWLIGGVICGVLLIGGVAAGIFLNNKFGRLVNDSSVVAQGKTISTPATVPSRLTGVKVAPELDARPVTGVMIENHPESRPQAGLKDAGVVFEAIAEGGITRFLALYQEAQPDYIGPVRSVRPYYLDFLVPFDAAIAHHGGSAEGLAQISNEGIKDLDQAAPYRRVNNRFAPHNLYTDMASLDALSKAKGYTSSTFTSWPRKKEKAAAAVTARVIDLDVSGVLYNPHFEYDAGTNSYKRSQAGSAHVDERSGEQISPKVVIALSMTRGQSGIYSVYHATGSGTVLVFQDGAVTAGTWQKASRKDQFVFTGSDGQPLKLNPGQTWVTLVAADSAVTYQP